jgi:hypothetical protein
MNRMTCRKCNKHKHEQHIANASQQDKIILLPDRVTACKLCDTSTTSKCGYKSDTNTCTAPMCGYCEQIYEICTMHKYRKNNGKMENDMDTLSKISFRCNLLKTNIGAYCKESKMLAMIRRRTFYNKETEGGCIALLRTSKTTAMAFCSHPQLAYQALHVCTTQCITYIYVDQQ